MSIRSSNYWQANANKVVAVTPSDTANIVDPTTGAKNAARSLYVTVAGNVHILTDGGSNVTLPVTVGQILPIETARVYATGTTATVFALF